MNYLRSMMFNKDLTDGGGLTAEEIAKAKELEELEKKKLEDEKEKTKEEDAEVKAEPKIEDESITLTKAELEQIKTQKYAEGARKATKENNTPEEKILAIQEELNQLRAEKMAAKIVDSKYQEDLVAIAKGKGLEITEENLKEIVKRHPEWLKSNQTNQGTITIGGSGGETKPGELDELSRAKKLFGNK